MVSAVMDYGRSIPQQNWTVSTWYDFTEIVKRLDAIDKKLGETDCEKSREWMDKIDKRLASLEKPVAKRRRKRAAVK